MSAARRLATPVVALGGGGDRLGASLTVATRGVTKLPIGALLVVASSALRGDDEAWTLLLRTHAAAGLRLGSALVEARLAAESVPREDFLAVVVRERLDRRSEPIVTSHDAR